MDELARWRAARQASRVRLRPGALVAILATGIVVAVHFAVGGCSVWLWAVALAAVWFQFLGDLLNFVLLGRWIARAEQTPHL